MKFSSFVSSSLREACEEALKEKHMLASYEMEGFIDEAAVGNVKQLKALERVFRKAGECDIPSEVFTTFKLLPVIILHPPPPSFS